MGNYLPLSLGGNIVVFIHDTGTSITQISTLHAHSLRHHGVVMRFIEKPMVLWKTVTGVEEIRMKLWLIKEVAILGLLEHQNTDPREIVVLENPKVRDTHVLG